MKSKRWVAKIRSWLVSPLIIWMATNEIEIINLLEISQPTLFDLDQSPLLNGWSIEIAKIANPDHHPWSCIACKKHQEICKTTLKGNLRTLISPEEGFPLLFHFLHRSFCAVEHTFPLPLCKIPNDLDDSKVKTTIDIGPNPWKTVINREGGREQLLWERCLGTRVGGLVGMFGSREMFGGMFGNTTNCLFFSCLLHAHNLTSWSGCKNFDMQFISKSEGSFCEFKSFGHNDPKFGNIFQTFLTSLFQHTFFFTFLGHKREKSANLYSKS